MSHICYPLYMPHRGPRAHINVPLRPPDRILLAKLSEARDIPMTQIARDAIRAYVPRELAKTRAEAAERQNPAA